MNPTSTVARSAGGKRRKRTDRRDSASYRETVLKKATATLLSCDVVSIDYPGGRSRESYRLHLDDGRRVIATRRSDLAFARREVRVLEALNRQSAPVPRLLATNHSQVLIQEYVAGRRLSEALQQPEPMRHEQLVDAALGSLAQIHAGASCEQLESAVEVLGETDGWIRGLLARPAVIGEHLGEASPPLDVEDLVHRLRVRRPRFIKWDARPGNAIVTDSGSVFWFDWEHAGARNRLDDLAWILGDEFLPDHPAAELSLIERHLPHFADQFDAQEAHDYLMTYGSFHMTVRLGLVLKYMDGEWWDLDRCIAEDKVGVTLECASRLCRRASRWAAKAPGLEPLSPWFEALEARLGAL